jgi:hypothetical protein
MSIFDFYSENGFKLFKCAVNKSPAVPKGTDWRDVENHLSVDDAERYSMSGGLIGAWRERRGRKRREGGKEAHGFRTI